MTQPSGGGRARKLLIWDFDGTLGYREGGAPGGRWGGSWTATLYEVFQQAASDRTVAGGADESDGVPGGVDAFDRVTYDALRPYLQSGFPWQTPEQSHPELRTPEAWWALMNVVFERAYRGVGVSPGRARDLAARVRTTYLDLSRWRTYDDVKPVLGALLEDGWTHAMLTNHVPELPQIVEAVGLTPYFARIFNSAQTGYEKPNPCAYRMVLEAMGHPDTCWMIGDNVHADVQGAEAVGIPGILVRRPPNPEARYRAETLVEVARILRDCAAPCRHADSSGQAGPGTVVK